MKVKFTAVIEVDVSKLGEATTYYELTAEDKLLLKQLVEGEFKWVQQSGISVKKLKQINEK